VRNQEDEEGQGGIEDEAGRGRTRRMRRDKEGGEMYEEGRGGRRRDGEEQGVTRRDEKGRSLLFLVPSNLPP
jgi:hypothetical protein